MAGTRLNKLSVAVAYVHADDHCDDGAPAIRVADVHRDLL